MIDGALEELDLTAIVAAFRDATNRHGHTADSDADRPLDHFAELVIRLAQEAADITRAGSHQNLDVAYRRAARLAAGALSAMRRIRLEQAVRS